MCRTNEGEVCENWFSGCGDEKRYNTEGNYTYKNKIMSRLYISDDVSLTIKIIFLHLNFSVQ